MNWRDTFVRFGTILVIFWVVNILVSWGMNFFMGPRSTNTVLTEEVKSGQRVTALPAPEIRQPLKLEIDFVDTPTSDTEHKLELPARLSRVEFTNFGATVGRLVTERPAEGTELQTVSPLPLTDKENRLFLVALDTMTPFFYTTTESKTEGNMSSITFIGESPVARITKTFTVSTAGNLLDLILTIEPLQKDIPVQPRLFIPAPSLTANQLGHPIFSRNSEMLSGVVLGIKGNVDKVAATDINDAAWAMPQMFGVQDRFFAHLLVKDHQAFARRGYFKHDSNNNLSAIIEGPVIKEKTTWTLSFYCGPKEAARLNEVDSRLEALLEYGWFSWFAKILMKILCFINSYVHNYGWAIIILALLINLIMFPFTQRGQKSMIKQQEMMKKMKHLEQKYADDKERLQQEKMELIRKYGAFPGGVGCLPLFIQIPIFAGLSNALRSAIELHQAPFIFWITDLSSPDPLYIIPILLGISTFFAAAKSTDAKQNVMMIIMSLVITGVMMKLSVGIGLYVLVGTLVRVIQVRVVKIKKEHFFWSKF
ncbi:TPA: hypothetical protein DDZ86_02440 [Candidatus Dependentiae bacterium]|nr:MAG: Membrane protein insertase YidC [candidate division TM6 bacterium GW2011_GWF2_43_87]HBL98478.1 hypothetical protein [Candidatus Dependentiae bacterium]